MRLLKANSLKKRLEKSVKYKVSTFKTDHEVHVSQWSCAVEIE